VVLLQFFAAWTDIDVRFSIKDEVAPRKRSVGALGLVHELHVRLDTALVDKPRNHLA
jgi:hypothetical protein